MSDDEGDQAGILARVRKDRMKRPKPVPKEKGNSLEAGVIMTYHVKDEFDEIKEKLFNLDTDLKRDVKEVFNTLGKNLGEAVFESETYEEL